MAKKLFVAFDFDDLGVKQGLIAQAREHAVDLDVLDVSVSEPSERWKRDAECRIAAADFVLVVCGVQTHQAAGVAFEIQVAQRLGKRYALLSGTRKGTPTRPKHARATDAIYTYTWATIKRLLDGQEPEKNAVVA